MQRQSFDELVERIVAEDPRYQAGAYAFLREALDFTQRRTTAGAAEPERHVSGQQLLEGIREYAVEQYGPMTLAMFGEWGIQRCEDFGEIVFNLIDHQVLRKTDTDQRDDFKGGYTFDAAFRVPFLPPSRVAGVGRISTSAPETA
jgi:uncharacterized repeat protein (TIGR04138 family)